MTIKNNYYYKPNTTTTAQPIATVPQTISAFPQTISAFPQTISATATNYGINIASGPYYYATQNINLPYEQITKSNITVPYGVTPFFQTKKNIKAYIKKELELGNYTNLCYHADDIARKDYKSFILIKNYIIKQNNFGITSVFIKSIENIDISDMTNILIEQYIAEKDPSKNYTLQLLMLSEYKKIDLSVYIETVSKKRLPEMLTPFLFLEINQPIMEEINVNLFQKTMLHSNNPSELLSFAIKFKNSDKKKVFKRLKDLGNKEIIDDFINIIDEPWVTTLRNIR